MQASGSSKPNTASPELNKANFQLPSRGDFYFGDDHTFNQTIFDETRSYWTAPIVDVQMAANARLARVHTSNATNPTFTLTRTGLEFGFGESAAYILVLGDRVSGTVPRPWVEYLFGKILARQLSIPT
jgi:Peroxidase, family 2